MKIVTSRNAWRVCVAAAFLNAGGLGLDLASHRWDWAAVQAAAVAMNGGWARYHYRRDHRPAPAPRPDYAKIRRLELELGLRDPGPVPDPEPVVRVSRPKSCPFGGTCSGCPHWPNCIEVEKQMTSPPRPSNWQQHYRVLPRVVPPPVTSVNEWAYCPVCTRRHAGRCAG